MALADRPPNKPRKGPVSDYHRLCEQLGVDETAVLNGWLRDRTVTSGAIVARLVEEDITIDGKSVDANTIVRWRMKRYADGTG